MLNLAAMPFHAESEQEHEAAARVCVMATAMPLVFVNQLGGQDELVFAGQSMAMAASGELCVRPPAWQAGLWLTEFVQTDNTWQPLPGLIAAIQSFEAGVYAALVCGLRDYMAKNNFQDVVLGLSGGIDSALVLAIAVDALGAERVEAVMMPSRYTAEMSLADAKEQAETLGVAYREIPIEPLFQAFLTSLQDVFAASAPDITEENLQARCRGVLLMAIANKKHKVVLIASNKSELAVGYTTLYGDMAGGFAVLKDVPKTLVYRLVKYRNSIGAAIPQRVIDRPPSAELAPDQQDTDSLPDYEILDDILQRYVVLEQDGQTIVAAGHYVSTVQRVMQLVESNEYKRQQAAPGVRISRRAFGRERRYPITSGFKNIVNFQHRK